MDFDYIVADPTGNITVLILSPYSEDSRQAMIRESFSKEPSCEQVGFLMPVDEESVRLEMMGYEFCGNATLSAAAWHAGKHGLGPGQSSDVTVYSSGADRPLRVHVHRLQEAEYEGTVLMPVPSVSSHRGYPLVQFDGISHLIVPSHDFTDEEAERSVREFAYELDVPAMGLMLCPDYNNLISCGMDICPVSIRPLVYVPGSDTVFWEHGCATGSTAIGWYRYHISGSTHTEIKQPGGTICVDITDGQPVMTGKVTFR